MKKCNKCDKSFTKEDFGSGVYCKKCWYRYLKPKFKQYSLDPRERMWASSRNTAYTKNIPHSISVSDIHLVSHCPYLNIELDYTHPDERNCSKRPKNMATLDKIDPKLGYVPGNVQVISFLANRLKNNATIDELLVFAHGVIKVHG